MHPFGPRSSEPTISIIIPAWNEARNLEVLLPTLPPVHQVIVINGASTDDTESTVNRVMPEAELIPQTRRGKGNALVCGYEAATGDIIVMVDADGSADPAEITLFTAALTDGADFAKGSRALPQGGSEDITWLRRTGNWGLTFLTNLLFRTRYSDLCYGYNAFWRDILPDLALPPSQPSGTDMAWGDGFEIETVLNCRVAAAGIKVREVPSVERLRLHGTSNLDAWRDGWRVLTTIVAEWRRWRRRRRAQKRARVRPLRSSKTQSTHSQNDATVDEAA